MNRRIRVVPEPVQDAENRGGCDRLPALADQSCAGQPRGAPLTSIACSSSPSLPPDMTAAC